MKKTEESHGFRIECAKAPLIDKYFIFNIWREIESREHNMF